MMMMMMMMTLIELNDVADVRQAVCFVKAAFHNTDIDTDILADTPARIVARMSVSVSMSVSWNAGFTRSKSRRVLAPTLVTRRHSSVLSHHLTTVNELSVP